MATPILKHNSIVAAVEESAEGTYAPPSSSTDGYFQPLVEGFDATSVIEKLDRSILDNSIGALSPRNGIKSVTGTLPVEFRASGIEGGNVDFGILLESLFGNKREIIANVTTKSGNTASQLEIEDADIGDFTVNDIIVIKESGDYHTAAITVVDTTGGFANIEITPAAGGAFADAVVISKSTIFFPGTNSHKSYSTSIWHGNNILQKAVGCKTNTLTLDNFTTGQIASFNFGFEGLTFEETVAVAPQTPSFDTGLPPTILTACLFQDGVQLDVNTFGLSITNTLSFLTSTCSSTGRTKSRVNAREVTGTINPYREDDAVAQFTKFDTNAAFSLFISAHNPSAVSGEFDLGSILGIYLPNCIITEKANSDQDGLLIEDLSFKSTRGDDSSIDEIILGLI